MEIEKLYKLFLESKGVSTDTRTLKKGQIFIALKGPNFDGNLFVDLALKKGAKIVICEYSDIYDDKILKVESGIKVLRSLALFHRNKFNIPVLAIAGSNGKTTTKNLIGRVLNQSFNCLISEKSFNNEIGLCKTLLNLNKKHQFAILEIGTNNKGEIKDLVSICKPNYGLLTNIGKEHLEGLDSIKGVIKEEGELFNYLVKNKGFIFVNNELPKTLLSKSKKTKHHICDLSLDKIKINNLFPINFSFLSMDIRSNLAGKWNIKNILLAVYVGVHFNVPKYDIEKAINGYKSENLRSEIIKYNKSKLFLDCYNSNPSSMKELLDLFSGDYKQKIFFVIGGMLELGIDSKKEHLKILTSLSKIYAEKVFLVGKEFIEFKDKFKDFIYFDNTVLAKNFIEDFDFPNNSLIIVKGSRGYALENMFGL